MRAVALPDIDTLNRLFEYDSETGKVFRRTTLGGCIAGTEAGYSNGKYRMLRVFGKSYLLHRIVWKMVYKEEPEIIDHINGIANDNRIANLRNVSYSVNSRNSKLRNNNTSGCPGVNLHTQTGKWEAHVYTSSRKRKNLGLFTSKEDAIKARKKAETENAYHTSHGRQI